MVINLCKTCPHPNTLHAKGRGCIAIGCECKSDPIAIQAGRSKHWSTMVNILEAQFPKGECKERGRALVMLAYIEMMINGMEFDDNGEPIT